MSALTVTLGADITALKRAMVGATELVKSSARIMGKVTGAGLAGLGKGGALALRKGFGLAGAGLKASLGGALAGGATAVAGGVKAVTAAAGNRSIHASGAVGVHQSTVERIDQLPFRLAQQPRTCMNGIRHHQPGPPRSACASSEEPGAGNPHAGICEGGAG